MKTFQLIRVLVPISVAAISSLSLGQIFDFESEAATGVSSGGLTTLSMTNTGLTMTITRPGGTAFDIVDNVAQPGKPASWGNRSLSPFFNTSGGAFIFDFSTDIDFFTIEAGDYGADSDDIVLEAWSGLGGTGTLIATAGLSYGTSAFPTVALTGSGIPGVARSIVAKGGSVDFPDSLFWDNVEAHAAPVPEPATFAILGIGAVALLRRKKK